jgi:multiple antibiotic resistance protein
MIELFVSAFVTFFVIIDPPGCAPIFASLTQGCTPAQRRMMALRSVLIAAGILLFFGLFGEDLLDALGISLAAFRIAGGIMLFLIALEMVFEKRTQRRENRANEVNATPEIEDISVFPMAIPMIAGPGSIASIMLLMARSNGLDQSLVVRDPSADLARAAGGGAADADPRPSSRGDDHPHPRRRACSARGSVRDRRDRRQLPDQRLTTRHIL